MRIAYWIPIAVLALVLALLIVALRRGLTRLFDRAWWAAVLTLMVLHATDLPFFDSRVNIAGWILLAGLRCSLRPSQERCQERSLDSELGVDA